MASEYVGTTQLEAYGRTQTLKQWSCELKVPLKTLKQRFQRRAKHGALSEEQIEECLQTKLEDKSVGARTRNIQRLMLAIEDNVSQEQLNKEIRDYVKANGALALYKELQWVFPKATQVALDGGDQQTAKPARITIFNANGSNGNDPSVIIDAE